MRFDHEIMRKIMLDVASRDLPGTAEPGTRVLTARQFAWLTPDNPDVGVEHVVLLVEGGWLDGERVRDEDHGGYSAIVFGLRPAGAELVAAIRDDAVWEQVRAVKEKVGGLPMDLLLDTAKHISSRRVTDCQVLQALRGLAAQGRLQLPEDVEHFLSAPSPRLPRLLNARLSAPLAPVDIRRALRRIRSVL